jgi:hypothetical protein
MDERNEEFVAEAVAEPEEKLTFREAMATLPRVLMVEVLKRFAVAFAVLVVTLIALFVSKDWMICAGFLLMLVAAYLGLDIIWKHGDGKLLVAKMIICKASRAIGKRDKYHLILRDASIQNLVGQDYDTVKVDIIVAARDHDNITNGTILNIYFNKDAPTTVLAYEILGEVGK